MEQDYLMRQFDQLGIVLEKLIHQIFNLKEQGKETEIPSEIEKELSIALGTDIKWVFGLSETEFQQQVLEKNDWTIKNLEQLLQLFQIYVDNYQLTESKTTILKKLLILITLLETKDRTFSLEREAMKKAVLNKLNDIGVDK